MKALLNGQLIEYPDLTWEQLCNPCLQILHDLPEDWIDSPRLNPETQQKRDEDIEKLYEFAFRKPSMIGDVMTLAILVLPVVGIALIVLGLICFIS